MTVMPDRGIMGTILILCNWSQGLYDFRNELVLELLKKHRVVVSAPDSIKTGLLEKEGCEIITSSLNRRGVNPVQDLKLIQEYRKTVRDVKPDLVLTYTIKPNVYGGMVCAEAGVPYISTITGLGSAFEKEGPLLDLVRSMYRRGLRKAACVFFQNRENLEEFRRMGLLHSPYRLVNGSGVNLDNWKPEPYPDDGVTEFLFVGRIMREKGIEELLAAARELHGNKVKFVLAGSCDEDYQELLNKCQGEGIIRQTGFQMDMHPLYRACSALVLPTYHEGMSNVLMEASACARPVIASNITGCREIFEEAVTGFGFAPKSADALSYALRRFLSLSWKERMRMGLQAREKVEREFDRRQIVAAYMEEIGKVLASGLEDGKSNGKRQK